LAPHHHLQGLLRQLTAKLFLALLGLAGLFQLRGVDTVRPYLGFADPDGVAINDAGSTG